MFAPMKSYTFAIADDQTKNFSEIVHESFLKGDCKHKKMCF
jgi:hypothetical protein